MHVREPIIKPVQVDSLRPTQMTVGMHEVAEKRKRWREHKGKRKDEFLGSHLVPVILGPKDRHYVIDHHHLARALLDEGQDRVAIAVVADLHALDREAFWVVLDNRGWCHPYDHNGVRCGFSDIPEKIADLRDDPYRSLAGELRRLGGYSKETVPFSEFLWADFLRRRLKRKAVENAFEETLEKAMRLAKSPDAAYLPGWCGPVTD
ncbi:MAG TPA: ParB-like protein [Xanthobacteraceae bacterium]|nr:ParB-like protein [Xanthobacteraceae bacterium]